MPPETGHNIAQLQSVLSHHEGGSQEKDETCFAILLHFLSKESKIDNASVFAKCGSDQISGFFMALDGLLSNNLIVGSGQGDITFGFGFMIKEFLSGIHLYRNIIGDTETLHQVMGELTQDMGTLTDSGTSSTEDSSEGDTHVRNEQEAYEATSGEPDMAAPSHHDHSASESFSHADAYRQKKSSARGEEHNDGMSL